MIFTFQNPGDEKTAFGGPIRGSIEGDFNEVAASFRDLQHLRTSALLQAQSFRKLNSFFRI